MFDITAIFTALANFFQFMMKWWDRSDVAKKKALYDQLEKLNQQIQNTTDETQLNILLDKKAAIVKEIAALGKTLKDTKK